MTIQPVAIHCKTGRVVFLNAYRFVRRMPPLGRLGGKVWRLLEHMFVDNVVMEATSELDRVVPFLALTTSVSGQSEFSRAYLTDYCTRMFLLVL